MIEIHQTIFGKPHGNCFQACVASVLEIPLDDVPHFCGGANPEWFAQARDFVAARSELTLLLVQAGPEWLPTVAAMECYSIVGGRSPRGDFLHSVVYFGDHLVHDPHPSGDGIVGAPEDWIFFVAKNPARRPLPIVAR